MPTDSKILNWESLSKEEQWDFNLKLGNALMKDIEEYLSKPNTYICSEGHDQKEWYCTDRVHFKRHPAFNTDNNK